MNYKYNYIKNGQEQTMTLSNLFDILLIASAHDELKTAVPLNIVDHTDREVLSENELLNRLKTINKQAFG